MSIDSSWPPLLVWAALIGSALTYFLRVAAESSELIAKLLGPVGRRWRDRGQRRAEERRHAREAGAAELEDTQRERDYFRRQLDHCRADHDRKDEFIAYDAQWHRDTRLRAIEAGCDLPEHTPFSQWGK